MTEHSSTGRIKAWPRKICLIRGRVRQESSTQQAGKRAPMNAAARIYRSGKLPVTEIGKKSVRSNVVRETWQARLAP